MKKMRAASLAAFLLLLVFMFGAADATNIYTKLYSVWIRNSQIDSTTVGATTPSTGAFTTSESTAYQASYSAQGSYTAWNQTNGGGEMDFIDSYGAGAGGFSWYATTGSPGSPVMTLSRTGVLSSTGGFNGNAATATALASTPTNCGSNGIAYGVAANGNAQCTTLGQANLTGSRSLNTVYTAGSIPLLVEVSVSTLSTGACTGSNFYIQGISNSIVAAENGIWNQCQGVASVTFFVPAGQTYEVTTTQLSGGPATQTLATWMEVTL